MNSKSVNGSAQDRRIVARENHEWKLEEQQAKAAVAVVAALAQSLSHIVEAYQYRKNLEAIVATLQADQTMRHRDVDKMLEIISLFGNDISQEIKDQYFLVILAKLTGGQNTLQLPSPHR